MKANIFNVFLLIYLLTNTSKSLNFEAAMEGGKFVLLYPGTKEIHLSPHSLSAQAFYLDASHHSQDGHHNSQDGHHHSQDGHHHSQTNNYSLTVTTQMSTGIDGFTGELSLAFLTLARNREGGSLHVVVRRGKLSANHEDKDIPDRELLPNTTHGIEKEHIFKTWDVGIHSWKSAGTEGKRSIEIEFSNWSRKSYVYLITTSYSYGSSASFQCPSSPWWRHPTWYDCQTDSHNNEHVCVNYDLTCDFLPHCAQQNLPNSDENCTFHIGLLQILEMIIYTSMAILLLLFVSAFAKYFILRRRIVGSLSGGNIRRHREIRELVAAAHRVQRPANAPPTYDDAMKIVNDSFDLENTNEDPPEYTIAPAPGEETCLSSPTSPTTFLPTPNSPTTSMNSQTSPTTAIPAILSPNSSMIVSSSEAPMKMTDIASVHNGITHSDAFPKPNTQAASEHVSLGEDDKDTAIGTNDENTTAEVLNSGVAVNVVGLTCFENNFIDIPLDSLPKDPPAYSYLP